MSIAIPPPEPPFPLAWDVNPPEPGDEDYDDYVTRQTEWAEWNEARVASLPPPPDLLETSYFDATFPQPEDRGTATLSDLGEVEYVEDFTRPGRIHLVAAEEGSGKTYGVIELAIRVAVAGGSFAGTWPILKNGPVLYLSEMHPDDDFAYETNTLASLGIERADLSGKLYRLPLATAAGGAPVLTVGPWRDWVIKWLREQGVLLMIVDTATGATMVDPWGKDIQQVYRDLRVMLEAYPALAIVLVVHLKKPQGHGERRISDVLGEWGRWCDVVILQENDGQDRAKVSVRKRVRHQRRIVATKSGGLLIDPVDADGPVGPKVPAETVLAAIVAEPGIGYAELGRRLGVSKDTASNYVKALGSRVVTAASGPKGGIRVYPAAEPPNTAERAASVVPSTDSTTLDEEDRRTAEPTYIGSVVPSSVVSLSSRTGGS